MKYEELKNEIRDLGFEDDQIFTEYLSIIQTSITRACRLIASTVKAPTGRIYLDLTKDLGRTTTPITVGSTTTTVVINGTSVTVSQFDMVTYGTTVTSELGVTSYHESKFYFDGDAWQKVGQYDLDKLSMDSDGNVMFDSIDRIVEDNDVYTKSYLNYDIVEDHILVIPSTVSKKLVVYYNERIIPITSQTQDDFEIQVVYPCEPLVALLAAHYVWFDDDERKAILYWNEYDQLRQEIEARAFKTKARIVGGF